MGACILDVLGRPVETIPPGVACGSLVATGLGSDAGIESIGQVLDFLGGGEPAAAGRIKELMP